jgi:DNA-binding transcriptional ArsR family regulator
MDGFHAMARHCADRAIDNVAKSPYSGENLLEVLMVGKSKDLFRQQARVLKALANESRLKIIDRLSRGECSVGELTDLVGSDRSTVSKHLALLRAHGIVLDRREGNVVYYTLLTPCVVNFFSCATQVLKERV